MIGIPADLRADPQLETREVFRKCLGHTFTIMGIDEFEDVPHPLVRLDVGEVSGHESYMDTIWIEPAFLEKVV